MSERKYLPSKSMASMAWYAVASASAREGAVADAAMTRPPAVTEVPSGLRRVPAWNSTASAGMRLVSMDIANPLG